MHLYAHREYLEYYFKLRIISILYQPIRKTSKEPNLSPIRLKQTLVSGDGDPFIFSSK